MKKAVVTIALAVTFLQTAPAIAGTYDVYACGGAAGNEQNAFVARADTSLMHAYSICPSTNIATGVATKVSSGGGMVFHMQGAYQAFDAPPDAYVENVTLSIAELRMESHWTVAIVAYDHFDHGQIVFGCGAGGPGCDVATPTFYGPVSVLLGLRRSFRLETRCGNVGGCSAASTGKNPANRALFSATNIAVRVADWTAPLLSIDGALWSDEWHRGTKAIYFDSFDNVGNRYNRLLIDGKLIRQDDFAYQGWHAGARCNYTRPRPCHDIVRGHMTADTTQFTDGEHLLRFEAIDAAGNLSPGQRTIKVDNTAPARISSVGIEGGDGWRRNNSFAAAWSTPPGQHAPIVRARYRLCRVGEANSCVERSQAGGGIERIDDLEAPDRGDYTLRIWLEDAAGNVDPQHAGDPVRVRFDDRPPAGAFDASHPASPATVSAHVVDHESGIANATIDMRRDGSRDWHELDSELNGSHLSAEIDDDNLPAGMYSLRLRAHDLAGNDLVTGARGDGSAMQLRLPLRTLTRLEAQVRTQAKATKKCVKRKRGKRRKRRCVKKVKQVSVGGDGRAELNGTLRTAEGDPVPNAAVGVVEKPRSQPRDSRSTIVRTDRLGRFNYRSAAGPSRSVMFDYRGTRLVKPSSGRIDLAVKARTSLRASPRSALNGQSVLFTGRLGGGFVPNGGKLVALQAHFRGRWRTFATPRSDPQGRWRYRYRFGATSGRVNYALRARIPFEAAYPFEGANSRPIHVIVRG